ncbi:MAG: PQQ-dependent sugar dehydrogenase [Bacteroidales bacterium]|nr:PQQ-dependent sugar dehydrogenase [Bacteroidales bacterium]
MLHLRPAWLIVPAAFLPLTFFLFGADPVPTPPTPSECRWATGPITIDGSADEAAWKDAQLLDHFHLAWLGKGDRPAKTATRARLLWDHQYLYFSADMDDADLFADVTEQDGNTWDNDVFELFFRPATKKPGYYEFQINAAGTVFDAFFPRQNLKTVHEQKKVGSFHIEQKVKRRGTLNQRNDQDQGWSVEGRIPWTDFLRTGGRPLPGEEWRFTLCRYDYDQKWPQPELSATAPLQARKSAALFHQLEDYAPLLFVGPKRGVPLPGPESYTPITTSTVVGSPDPPLPYRMTRVYPGFSPAYLINVKAVPHSDQLLYLSADRPGSATTLYRITDTPDMTGDKAVKVMETPDNGTAYDIAFHPQFAENGFVYIGWNGAPEKGTRSKTCRVTRYTMARKAPYALDAASARTIVEWPSNGHNGAAVCFGRDGHLYVTTGDGTSDSDTNLMGQSTDTLLSKVLRLDVDHPANGKAYAIPPDNPFVSDKRFAPETYAYGLRNPWRICCDAKTGQIWVGNNGQDLWETAYLVRPGDNYGWSVMEGSHPFYLERQAGPTPFTKPTIEHNHAEFRSLTGGIVYYGEQLPDLNGVYLYGDHSTGHTWGMRHDGKKPIWHRELARGPHHISAYSTNTRGELLICDHGKAGEGGLYTLTPTPKDLPPSTFPRKLSDSGLFDSVPKHKLKPGAIPYSVNAEFWSDGLYKERYMVLPPGGTIAYTSRRGWDFPDRSVLVKSFAIELEEGNPASRKWIETRFLTKQDTEWIGYTYVWNEAGTDAELLGAAARDQSFSIRVPQSPEYPKGIRTQVWHYPSRTECMVCHARAARFTLGPSLLQMNKLHDYGNGIIENQLVHLDRLGLFGKSPNWAATVRNDMKYHAELLGMSPADAEEYVKAHAPQPGQRVATLESLVDLPGTLAKLADPYDQRENLNFRARSWIHANCAYCHVEAGGGNAAMNLEFHVLADKMKLFDEKPLHTTFGIPEARIVACGAPDQSVLLKRIATRGPNQMPPLATSRQDVQGIAMMREWIASLKK